MPSRAEDIMRGFKLYPFFSTLKKYIVIQIHYFLHDGLAKASHEQMYWCFLSRGSIYY